MKFLNPTKEVIKPKTIYGFDIETTSDDNNFLMGSITTNGFKKIFWDKYEMIYFFMTHTPLRYNSYIVATNLGFDILGTFEETDYLKDLDFTIRGGKIIIANIKDGLRYYVDDKGKLKDTYSYKISFLDTMNFVPYSVKSLGNIINLSKLPYPKCLKDKRAPRNNEEKLELIRYNLRDSEISQKFFEFLQNGYNKMGVNIRPTVASTSMSLFKNKYLKDSWLQPETKLLEKQFYAYYGGRTEVFIRGLIKGKFYYYDVNNLYGKPMTEKYPYPNSLKVTPKNKNYKYRMDIIEQFEGISYIEAITPKINIPLLPYRDELTKRLIFPTGKINGYYTNIEIRKAIKEGYKINKIGYQQYYTCVFYPFKEYIETNYKKKKECAKNNNPMELLYKLNNNSLYGKFAQKINGKQRIIHMNNVSNKLFKYYTNNENYKVEQIDEFLYITEIKGLDYPSFINPIMSLYTTAKARLIMFDYLKEHSGKVYYTDTDSLITEKPIKTSSKIGKMKEEYRIKKMLIVRPKTYAFITDDNKKCIIRTKGLPPITTDEKNKTKEIIANERFKKFSKIIKNRTITYNKFIKFKEANRSKEHYKNGKLKYNQVIEMTKTMDLEDTKRKWKKKINIKEKQISKPIHIK